MNENSLEKKGLKSGDDFSPYISYRDDIWKEKQQLKIKFLLTDSADN